MKREYVRPMMYAEAFAASQDVASGCTRVATSVTTINWPAQTVDCIITESHNIFGSANCTDTDYTQLNSGALVPYDADENGTIDNDEYYFVWKSDSAGEIPPSDTSLLDNIVAEAEKTNSITGSGAHYHAGPVDYESITETGYSFSY